MAGKRAAPFRHLASHLMTAHEEERKRIARELHDNLGQALTLMKLRLGGIRKKLRRDQPELQQQCDETLIYIDQVIESVRCLSRDLSPTILEDLGLMAAIRRLTKEFVRNTKMPVSLKMDDIDDLFPPHSRIGIYRIIQEALVNVGEHAGANNLRVDAKKGNARVSFRLAGDGIALPSTKPECKENTGTEPSFAIMSERIRILGGTLDLESKTGEGTIIQFSIPFAEKG